MINIIIIITLIILLTDNTTVCFMLARRTTCRLNVLCAQRSSSGFRDQCVLQLWPDDTVR